MNWMTACPHGPGGSGSAGGTCASGADGQMPARRDAAYVREDKVYGTLMIYPDCPLTKAVCEELGSKTLTARHVAMLKRMGFMVRVRGFEGRTL